MIKIGSLFAGIGLFELGLERAIENSQTIWQVEQNSFCQKILKKHWPDSIIYDDVCTVGKHNLEPVDILCGGFPCQDISTLGKQGGIHAKKSGLWWEMHRIISEIRPRIAIMENVSNLLTLGMSEVIGALAEIGYDAEWTIVSAGQFGAPHKRDRVFIIAYSMRSSDTISGKTKKSHRIGKTKPSTVHAAGGERKKNLQCSQFFDTGRNSILSESTNINKTSRSTKGTGFGYWKTTTAPSPVCGVDDGGPHRVDQLRALGNAIVPQCSEWVGRRIMESGLLTDTSTD